MQLHQDILRGRRHTETCVPGDSAKYSGRACRGGDPLSGVEVNQGLCPAVRLVGGGARVASLGVLDHLHLLIFRHPVGELRGSPGASFVPTPELLLLLPRGPPGLAGEQPQSAAGTPSFLLLQSPPGEIGLQGYSRCLRMSGITPSDNRKKNISLDTNPKHLPGIVRGARKEQLTAR